MVRLLNVLAIAALVGSAIYAYSIKYETIFRGEQIVQLRHQIRSQQDSIAMLKAEWEHVSRPERIQELADQFLDLQQPSLRQIVPITALPDKAANVAAATAKPDVLAPAPESEATGDSSNTPRNPHMAGETTPN
ncbi:MAG: cell division protein FtsL [Methylovirgula sp.]